MNTERKKKMKLGTVLFGIFLKYDVIPLLFKTKLPNSEIVSKMTIFRRSSRWFIPIDQ